MKQLVVKYEWVSGLTFPDGTPLSADDFELAYHIDCDPVWGAAAPGTPGSACDKIQDVTFDNDTTYTVTWKPGMQDPEYFLPPFGYYPAHRVLSDGRQLADVPASDWADLPEITQSPVGVGPYQVSEWEPGQRLVLEANPFYWKGADALQVKTIVFQFSPHPADAVQQLLDGRVDVLGPETIGVGGETLQIMAAAQAGSIQAQVIPSPFWEHIDMNLFLP
jgi:ABC-type transport system substrate-binding protein